MLEVGGGGGGTPWESYDMAKMHELIQNPDIDAQEQIVGGWRKTAELIISHRYQVEQYRENLASAWPPKTSAAAEAYIDRLDVLIKSLSDTYEAALANHQALADATLSMSVAREKFQKIFDEYQGNEQLIASFQASQATQQSSSTPTPSPSPSGEQPPVAPGRQEELKRQAATLLSGVSSDLAAAQSRISTPQPYQKYIQIDRGDPSSEDNFVPPAIPPITPIYASEDAQANRGNGSSRSHVTTPSNHNVPTPGIGSPTTGVTSPVTAPTANHPGTVLTGAAPTVAPPPNAVSPATPSLPSAQGSGPWTSPSATSPIATTPLPFRDGSTSIPASGGGIRAGITPQEGLVRPGAAGGSGLRPMPPGGVIGSVPSSFGQPVSPRAGFQRVNPIGGVIGENLHGGQSAGRGIATERSGAPGGLHGQVGGQGAGRGVMSDRSGTLGRPYSQASVQNSGRETATERSGASGGLHGRSGGRRKGKGNEVVDRRWDPENPWAVEEGVEPVVLPATEQRIDPGPAIGLR